MIRLCENVRNFPLKKAGIIDYRFLLPSFSARQCVNQRAVTNPTKPKWPHQ